MNRLITRLLQSLALLIVPLTIGLGSSVAAVDVFQACNNGASTTDVCQSVCDSSGNCSGTTTKNPFIKILKVAITVVSVIIGIAAVIIIIVSGIRFVTSGSDPQAVASARSGIIYALVGLAIAALAESLVTFVLNKL